MLLLPLFLRRLLSQIHMIPLYVGPAATDLLYGIACIDGVQIVCAEVLVRGTQHLVVILLAQERSLQLGQVSVEALLDEILVKFGEAIVDLVDTRRRTLRKLIVIEGKDLLQDCGLKHAILFLVLSILYLNLFLL